MGANVRRSMEAWHVLADAGFAPFSPLLFHFLHIHLPRLDEFWVEQELVWLEDCDALLRLSGHSPGGDREVTRALELGIPVVLSNGDLEHAIHELDGVPKRYVSPVVK
jgi:hypothetical protein